MRIVKIRTARGNIQPMDIEGHLYDLQYHVGGYIEPVYIPGLEEKGIILLADEEGLLKQLPVNMNLLPFFYVGALVAVGTDGDNFTSLTDEQTDFLRKWIADLIP